MSGIAQIAINIEYCPWIDPATLGKVSASIHYGRDRGGIYRITVIID